jgi:hypothetical protein
MSEDHKTWSSFFAEHNINISDDMNEKLKELEQSEFIPDKIMLEFLFGSISSSSSTSTATNDTINMLITNFKFQAIMATRFVATLKHIKTKSCGESQFNWSQVAPPSGPSAAILPWLNPSAYETPPNQGIYLPSHILIVSNLNF